MPKWHRGILFISESQILCHNDLLTNKKILVNVQVIFVYDAVMSKVLFQGHDALRLLFIGSDMTTMMSSTVHTHRYRGTETYGATDIISGDRLDDIAVSYRSMKNAQIVQFMSIKYVNTKLIFFYKYM